MNLATPSTTWRTNAKKQAGVSKTPENFRMQRNGQLASVRNQYVCGFMLRTTRTCRRPWRLPCPPPLRPLLSLLFPLAHPSLPSFHLHLPLNPILFSLLSLLGRCPRLFSLSARSRTFLTIRPQTTSHFPSEFQFCCDPHENIDHQVLHFSPSAASVLISVTIDAQL